MKKRIFQLGLVGMFCFSLQNATAQLSIGANAGIFKTLVDGSEIQFGPNVNVKYNITENLRLGANLGYFFRPKNNSRIFTMPITGLVEYSFGDNDFRPYVGADLGFYRIGAVYNKNTQADGNFGLAPCAGMNYSFSDNLMLDANLKYHFILTEGQSTSALGLSVGISYLFD